MITGEQVAAAEREWINTPFRHQGRNRAGIDCVGLLVVVAIELKLSDYDLNNYPRRPDNTFLSHFIKNMTLIIPITDAVNGNALIFSEGLSLCHCGIMATVSGQPGIIHAAAFNRSVLEETLIECEDE